MAAADNSTFMTDSVIRGYHEYKISGKQLLENVCDAKGRDVTKEETEINETV